MNTDKEIEKLRRKVDAFDDRILDILVQRFSVVKEIGQIKSISTINSALRLLTIHLNPSKDAEYLVEYFSIFYLLKT